VAIPGAFGQTYTPDASDLGHQLSCTEIVYYNLVRVTTSAESAGRTVVPQPAGAAGGQGPAGEPGASGPRGRPGRDATVTCSLVRAKKKRLTLRCRLRRVSAPAKHARWRLTRRGRTVAAGSARVRRGRFAVRVREVAAGRYRLKVAVGPLVLEEALRVR
jgi:hypothetical protein